MTVSCGFELWLGPVAGRCGCELRLRRSCLRILWLWLDVCLDFVAVNCSFLSCRFDLWLWLAFVTCGYCFCLHRRYRKFPISWTGLSSAISLKLRNKAKKSARARPFTLTFAAGLAAPCAFSKRSVLDQYLIRINVLLSRLLGEN